MTPDHPNYAGMMRLLNDQDHLDELLADRPPQIFEPVVRTREEMIRICSGARIDSFVKLEGGKGLTIGRDVHIASFAHINIGGGETFIGDYAAVASGARLISGSNHPDALSMSASAPAHFQRIHTYKVVLEKFACVLTNAIVLPGVTLHEGAVLGAGSLANQDIPAWEVWVGTPARFIRKRSVR